MFEQPLISGTEDCLYTNIFVPLTNKSEPLPVIIFIHGGGFSFDSALELDPKFFMDKDMICIAINYRLGPLGFLSTEDSIIPGNMGLKDQAMAIKWIYDNVAAFNGDLQKIKIIGFSARAASVQYHYLSPMTRGLFQNGISFSGTCLSPWAQTENSREKALKIGALLECPTENMEETIKCLKTRPGKDITASMQDFLSWKYKPFTPFGPVVERNSSKP